MKTIKMFCANQQAETAHSLDVDGVGEIILTCTENVGTEKEPVECGRFVKLPKGTGPKELKAYIEAHASANEGQVSQAMIDAKKAELLDALVPDDDK